MNTSNTADNEHHDNTSSDTIHDEIITRNGSVLRRPYYMFVVFLISVFALAWSVSIFIRSMHIQPTQMYIPSTASDTAVSAIPTNLPILPAPEQELNPGKRLSEQESLAKVTDYLPSALTECFTMNYINYARVLSKCKSHHLDTESDTQDKFVELLENNNYLDLIKRYRTAATLHVDKSSIKLINSGTASMRTANGTRTRFIWIFRLSMNYTMESVDIISPTEWEVEIIRESTLTKEFPVSIFKIRTVQ